MKTTLTLLALTLLPFLVGISLPVPGAEPITPIMKDFNPEHLDGAFTGGFGEQTCHSCHFDYEINREGGSLSLQGIQQSYQSGKKYDLAVTVQSEHLEIGGFQMTARFEDGTQAGNFNWDGDRLMLTPAVSDEIQYLQHSSEGTSPTNARKVSWNFTWEAPEEKSGPVFFNIAGNAGNNDDSAFGDWIYAKEWVLEPK